MTRLEEAVIFAAQMHAGQKRKLTYLPYILHPMETAVIVGTMTNDEDVIIASILHDVVEDTPATEEDLRNNFGDRVADFVAAETENKRPQLAPEDTWRIRKEEALGELAHSNREVKMLWLADKLSNIRSMANEYKKIGDEIFAAFHEKRKSEHEWYYRTIVELLKPELGNTLAFNEYERLTNFVFGGENK